MISLRRQNKNYKYGFLVEISSGVKTVGYMGRHSSMWFQRKDQH